MPWFPEPGVDDHGGQTGLTDKGDHPQYLLGTDGGKGTINVVAASGATLTLDLVNGNDHDVTLTANCTISLAGATSGFACFTTVLLRQDATGSRTVTWPASVEWVGGTAPTLQTAANTWDLVALVTYYGGTTWFAQHADTASAGGSGGEILISDTPSTPLIFADLLQNEAQDDLIYAD